MAPRKKAHSLNLKRNLSMLSEGKEDEDEHSTNRNDKRTNVAIVVDTVVDDGESDDSDPSEEQLFSGKSSDLNLEPKSKSVSSTSSKSSASSISVSTPRTPSWKSVGSTPSSSSSNRMDDEPKDVLHIAGPVEMKDLTYGKISK